MKRVVILIAISVLVGFVPMLVQNRALRDSLHEAATISTASREKCKNVVTNLSEKLREFEVQANLGMVIIEVSTDNFGQARARSTIFFDTVAAAVNESASPDRKARLDKLSQRRDEITIALASKDPQVVTMLQRLYEEFYTSVERERLSDPARRLD